MRAGDFPLIRKYCAKHTSKHVPFRLCSVTHSRCRSKVKSSRCLVEPVYRSFKPPLRIVMLSEDLFTPKRSSLLAATSVWKPSTGLVHAVLIIVQTIFGVGSVVGGLGLPAFNPLVFALIRELCAGTILLIASVVVTGLYPNAAIPCWRRFVILGFMIFLNQGAFIIGIKLADPVAGSIWQPSQAIMTAAICMGMGWEAVNPWRLAGIALAFAGSAVMVTLDALESRGEGDDDDGGGSGGSGDSAVIRAVAGNIFFFFNCLGLALYVILSKKALSIFPSVCVTAWSYAFAAVMMAATTLLLSLSDGAMEFLCPDCPHGQSLWHVPPGAIYALCYWVVVQSAIAYSLLTWTNQHATSTLVIAYSVLQPVVAAALTGLLLIFAVYPSCGVEDDDDGSGDGAVVGGVNGNDHDTDDNGEHKGTCLKALTWGGLGALGVFAGLCLVISTEPEEPHLGFYHLDPLSSCREDSTCSGRSSGAHSGHDVFSGNNNGVGGGGGGGGDRNGYGNKPFPWLSSSQGQGGGGNGGSAGSSRSNNNKGVLDPPAYTRSPSTARDAMKWRAQSLLDAPSEVSSSEATSLARSEDPYQHLGGFDYTPLGGGAGGAGGGGVGLEEEPVFATVGRGSGEEGGSVGIKA